MGKLSSGFVASCSIASAVFALGCVAPVDSDEAEVVGTAEQRVCTQYTISSAVLDAGKIVSGEPLSYMFDGSSSTDTALECSDGPLSCDGTPPQVTFDLGSAQSVNRIEIDWYIWGANSFDLLGSSDGSSWTSLVSNASVASPTFSGTTSTHTFTAASYRYIRLHIDYPGVYLNVRSNIREVRVKGGC